MLYHKHFFKITTLTIFLFSLTGMLCNKCFAQEHPEAEAAFHPHSSFGLVLSHAKVFKGRDAEGNKKALSLPSWGIDYNYSFHSKWSIGLHTDVIIEKFEVEKNLESGSNEETIERSYPIAPALMGI